MSVPSRPILGIRQGRFSGPFPALHDAIKLFLVTKAAQDVPPGIRQAIVRVHVPEAADRPIVQIAEPEPATTRKEHPQMRHTALKIYPQVGLMRGGPLSASRIHPPLCGYAATEGGKAAQEDPPGKRQAIVRGHAPEAAERPIAQKAEPEPFSQRSGSAARVYPIRVTSG